MDRQRRSPGRALVVADGEVGSAAALNAAWPGWRDGVELIVAADGGWARAVELGLQPDLLVGDADSLPEATVAEVAAAGIPVERSPAAKDESDTELALLAALRRGATRISVLGALGGARFDHALANVWLLALAPPEVSVELLDPRTRVRLLRAPGPDGGPARCSLPGRLGDLVTLLPFAGAAEGVTTHGLRYPLRAETLEPGPARGLSNVRTAPDAAVTLAAGRLVVVETLASEPTPTTTDEGEPA